MSKCRLFFLNKKIAGGGQFHLPIMRFVRKLTRVPSAAVHTVCSKSPSEILAQMEQIVLPREEMSYT